MLPREKKSLTHLICISMKFTLYISKNMKSLFKNPYYVFYDGGCTLKISFYTDIYFTNIYVILETRQHYIHSFFT